MSARSEPRLLGLLLRRFTLRHWRQAPRQSAVLVLILALGIGVFFAMRLANRAVLARFESFTDLVSQESDWVADLARRQPAGDGAARDARLLGERPVSLVPVLEITGAAPAAGRRTAGTARAGSTASWGSISRRSRIW